jgi:hypothetical protein
MNSTGARVQRVGGPVGEVRGSMMPQGGGFDYPSVPAGEYWLMGVARPSPTAQLEFTVARLTIAGEDVRNVTLTTAKGAVVNGRVDVEGGAMPSPPTWQVVAHPTEFEPPTLPLGAPDDGSTVNVASDGTFAFTSLFAPRLVRVLRLPAGWALKAALLDGVDIVDTPVNFRGGARPHDLRIVVTSRTGRVSGVVRDPAGRILGDARVVAFPPNERSWGFRSRFVKTAESDAQGRYTIDGLIGGDYHLVAVPFLESGSWMDPGVLRRLPAATSVTVKDGASVTMDLVVT